MHRGKERGLIDEEQYDALTRMDRETLLGFIRAYWLKRRGGVPKDIKRGAYKPRAARARVKELKPTTEAWTGGQY